MPPNVVAASPNNFNIGLCDFGPTPPTSVIFDPPAIFNNCVVDAAGNTAVVGDFGGGRVQLLDITNPSVPVPRGFFDTMFGGVGAVAISGVFVAAGERNGFRCALIDFTNPNMPLLVATTNTPLGGFSSLAFRASRIVVGGGPNGPPNCVEVDFNPTPPLATSISPGFTGGCAVDADLASNRIVVGNMLGGQVVFLNGATKAVLATVTTTLGGVRSVSISGTLVLAGSANSFDIARINFGAMPPVVTTQNLGSGSGSVVALSGTTGAAGAIVGSGTTPVKLLNVATGITVTGTCNPNVASVQTLAFGALAAAVTAANIDAAAPAFAITRVNSTSMANLVISNTGTAPLTVTGITKGGANPLRYTVGTPTSFTIAVGGAAKLIPITFAPNAEQVFPATLTIASNDPTTPSLVVAITGTGALPHLLVNPALALGNQAINCGTASQALTLTNTGGLPLVVTSISAVAPFGATPSNATLPAGGGMLAVTITFAPSTLGAATGPLTIVSNDATSPTKTVNLSGTGVAPPPPVISVLPASFNFGNVPRQNNVGLWVTVANTSPCLALTVGLSTGGLPFLVGAAGVTSLPVNPQTINDSIGPNQSRKYPVFFAPTALGSATGSLTITSNDPAHATQAFPLTGTGVNVPAVALELVLDRSGSMSDNTAGGTKMGDLKRTVAMFADVVIPGQGHEMGSVQFNHLFSVLTPRGSYDAAKQAQIKADANTLTPQSATAIGGGLQVAQGELAASTIARKAILVFTDGLETASPSIASVQPGIVAAGIESYAVGLGGPADIAAAALSALAASSNGKFFLTDDALVLNKHFVQVLTNAYQLAMVADPIQRVASGATVTVPVWITDCERRVSFVLSWDQLQSQLGFEIVAPDGTVFSAASASGNRFVRFGQQPRYRYYQIEFPPITPPANGYMGPQRAGVWLLKVTGTQVSGASERFATNVFAESDLMMEVSAKAGTTAQPLSLTVKVAHGNVRVKNFNVKLNWSVPTKPLSAVISKLHIKNFIQVTPLTALLGPTPLARAIRAFAISGKTLIPVARKKHNASTRRGIYSNRLPAPLVPGVYSYEIEVTGNACGGTFQRYASGSVYVGNPVSKPNTPVVVVVTGTTATVTVTPTGSTGVKLGPGLGTTTSANVARGRVLGIIDNLDGSYTVTVAFEKRDGTPTLQLDIAGSRLKVALKSTPKPPKKKSPNQKRAK